MNDFLVLLLMGEKMTSNNFPSLQGALAIFDVNALSC